MGRNAGNVYIAVKGDLDPLDRALKSARRLSDSASKKIKSAFEKIEGSAKKTAKAITSGLGGAISGLAVGALATQAIELADRYTLLEGRLKLVVSSSEDLSKVQKELFRQSQETGTSYESNIDLFTRLSRSTKNLKISQEDVLKVTDTLNKSIVVSGASSIEASNALIQLSQGLASNRLGGEELRSVMEQIPRVSQMIADGLRVDIGKFREMSKQGLLTTEVVTKALLAQADVIQDEFDRMPMTINRSWTMITNSVGMAIDQFNKSTETTSSLAMAMAWLSETIDKNIDGMVKFLNVTISGIEHLAKIAAVGGALYLLPIIITKTHEAMVLLNFTIFKAQSGIIGLNTALYGTSVSAQLAAGSLSKMQLAGSLLFALFAGWELGKWANDNFEEVRLAGLATVAQLDESWIKFKFNFQQLWIDSKFFAFEAMDGISNKVADVIESIAEKLSGATVTIANPFGDDFQIGLDGAASKLSNVAEKMRESADSTANHEKATNKLREEMDKALDIHNRTVDTLISERAWTKDVTEAVDESAQKHNEYGEVVQATNSIVDESTTSTAEAVLSAHDKMYKDIGEMSIEYQEFLFEQLDAQYEKYEEIGADTLLLDKWYFKEREKIQDKFAKKTITVQDTIAEAVSKSAEAGALAWMKGEDAKTSASRIAADILTENALKAAQEPLKKGLGSILGEQLGAWVGLGAGQSSVEGETWQDRVKNGLMYLAQAGGIILAGKAVGSALYADGGWIGEHPGGGIINKGSGLKDDVLLSFSNGGNVANMGMGGEYVIPRRQTQKHKKTLDAIRTDSFEDGGPIGDPMELAHNINAGGFSTFFTEWVKTGNYKQGIKAAIIYYLTTAGAMGAGKMWGGEILNFADGGVTGLKNFQGGGPVVSEYKAEEIDTNLTRQIEEWISDWTGVSEDILDPMGAGVGADDVLDALNSWIGKSGMSVGAGGISDIFKGIYNVDVPKWLDRGMISNSIDTLDNIVYPFANDILTPGKGVDFPGSISYIFSDALENSVESGVKDLVGLDFDKDIGDIAKDIFDPFDIFHDGTSFVDETGPAIIQRGERIFSAPENYEIMSILRDRSMGGDINVSVYPSFKVMIGDEDFTDKVEIITENVIVEREDRGLIGTGERVRF